MLKVLINYLIRIIPAPKHTVPNFKMGYYLKFLFFTKIKKCIKVLGVADGKVKREKSQIAPFHATTLTTQKNLLQPHT